MSPRPGTPVQAASPRRKSAPEAAKKADDAQVRAIGQRIAKSRAGLLKRLAE